MKTDLRTIKTQQNIQQTLRNLLKATSFDKITVQQICKEAQINRKTFYAHYEDKYDLMKCLLDIEVEIYRSEWMNRIDMVNNLESVDVIFDLMVKSYEKTMPNIEFYRHCLGLDFSDVLYDIVYNNIDNIFNRFSENIDDELTKHIFTWTSVGYMRYLVNHEPISFIDYYSKVSKSAGLYVESFEYRKTKQKQ